MIDAIGKEINHWSGPSIISSTSCNFYFDFCITFEIIAIFLHEYVFNTSLKQFINIAKTTFCISM